MNQPGYPNYPASIPDSPYSGVIFPNRPSASSVVYVGNQPSRYDKSIFNPNQNDRRNGCIFSTLPENVYTLPPSHNYPQQLHHQTLPSTVSGSATYSGYPSIDYQYQNPDMYYQPLHVNGQASLPRPNLTLKNIAYGNIEGTEADSPQHSDSQNGKSGTFPRSIQTAMVKKKKTSKLPVGCTGLINLGNTCYMNAVLQCLSHTRPLLDYCFDEKTRQDVKKRKNTNGVLANALADIFKQMWSGHKYLDPTDFRNKMLISINFFNSTEQEDAQEFLIFLLQRLSEDLCKDKLKKKYISIRLYDRCDKYADNAWKEFLNFENNIVTDIFMGQLRSTLTCSSCQHVSQTFDPALGLSLPINGAQNGASVTLLECLGHYFQEETLKGDEKPACSKCKKKSNAKKCLSIQKFPKIFVIHLKRFSSQCAGAKKIATPVQYPIGNLNFKEFASVDANVTYNLYAVVEHVGSLANGHYTSYIKNCGSKEWFNYDDDVVVGVPEKKAVAQDAYILFYQLHSAERESQSFSTFNLKNLFIKS